MEYYPYTTSEDGCRHFRLTPEEGLLIVKAVFERSAKLKREDKHFNSNKTTISNELERIGFAFMKAFNIQEVG